MNQISDQYYITKTLHGNVSEYAHLVERYRYMVYTLILRIVKNKEDAEEIAQDVFVKSFKNLKNFKGDSKFSTWIYKIAYFASLDHIKKRKRMANQVNIEAVSEDVLKVEQDSLTAMYNRDRKKVIAEALLKLPEVERTILTLYYFEELPVKEISIIVNLTVDNIKVKLYRARKKLYEILKNVIEPESIDLS